MIEIKSIKSIEDIESVLESFRQEMPRLEKKVGSFGEYARKLSANAEFLLMLNDNEPLGFISFYDNSLDLIGYISLIVLHEKYQRHGYGSILMNKCVGIMQTQGMKIIELEVDAKNKEVVAFYMKNGFRIKSGDNDRIILRCKI